MKVGQLYEEILPKKFSKKNQLISTVVQVIFEHLPLNFLNLLNRPNGHFKCLNVGVFSELSHAKIRKP